MARAPEGGQPGGSGPILPPRASSSSDVSTEMWDRWATEMAASAATSGRRSRRQRHHWLLPTAGAAIIATLGWVGLVLSQMMLLGALVPSFDLGDTQNFVVSFDDHPWFGATTIVSATAAYRGWLWWTVSAAFNVRRVSPLSTSLLLPIAAYLIAPVGVLAGLEMRGPDRVPVLFVAFAALGLGHVMVVGSFRSAASRIGAQSDEFAKLLWLPMAGVVYRVFVNVVVGLLPDEWQTTSVLFGLGAIGALFVCGMVLSTWRATMSFEYACQRLNTRTLGSELPSAGLIGEALRKSG